MGSSFELVHDGVLGGKRISKKKIIYQESLPLRNGALHGQEPGEEIS